MSRVLIIGLFATLIAFPVMAEDTLTPLTPEELREQVGGLRTPTGIEFGLGAIITTYVDGQQALQSHLTWTDQGVVETTDGGSLAGAAGAGIHVDGSVPGLYLPGQNGGTVVLHDLGDGRIGSVVLNTADNRDIRQETVINLDIPQLQNLQQDFANQKLEMNLQDSLSRALTNVNH
ncbi:hypothetical protein [Asticcacaulis sp.]|uniref:hypothetical protein n=1 Tax=Asticcacaulis sp. TaxID=1872648 RepID=UPI002CE889EF|nr:hypothetical protein [Asticcacaulis sp.]HTM79637.1 hypothetical protein [Asticcacaulis sp.]